MSLIRELMRSGNIDVDYLRRYTNAPWLVIRNPGNANDGLILRDADGEPKVIDRLTGCLLYTSPSPRDATLSRMPSSA